MKKLIIVSVLAVAIGAVCLLGCASKSKVKDLGDFSDVVGTELKLLEVHVDGTFGREILFDRKTLVKEGDGEIYTLTFGEERITGVGLPNRYIFPYTLSENQTITILPAATTMMATIGAEPEKLPEFQFFSFMHNAYEWRLDGTKLEILSKTEDGRDVRLVFGQ